MYNFIDAALLCSADGSTHTESNKLYRKVKHRYPQIFLHANGQRPKRAMIRQRSRRRQRRGETHTEHGLGVNGEGLMYSATTSSSSVSARQSIYRFLYAYV